MPDLVGRLFDPDRLDHTWVGDVTYTPTDEVAEACAYANICETCPSFSTTPEFIPALTAQRDDIQALRDDAQQRGWTSETARHDRVITSLDRHLLRHQTAPPT